MDWLAAVDGDEFVHFNRSLRRYLADLPDTTLAARLRPWEVLVNPKAGRKHQAEYHFKGAPEDMPGFRRFMRLAYGEHASKLFGGLLSHTSGKYFSRTGVKGLTPVIHGPFLNKDRILDIPTVPDARLLHFHAESWEDWRKHIEYRTEKGAYRASFDRGADRHDAFSAMLADGDESGLRAFFDAVQVLHPELRRQLRRNGLLFKTDLWLNEKVADVFGGNPGAHRL